MVVSCPGIIFAFAAVALRAYRSSFPSVENALSTGSRGSSTRNFSGRGSLLGCSFGKGLSELQPMVPGSQSTCEIAALVPTLIRSRRVQFIRAAPSSGGLLAPPRATVVLRLRKWRGQGEHAAPHYDTAPGQIQVPQRLGALHLLPEPISDSLSEAS